MKLELHEIHLSFAVFFICVSLNLFEKLILPIEEFKSCYYLASSAYFLLNCYLHCFRRTTELKSISAPRDGGFTFF